MAVIGLSMLAVFGATFCLYWLIKFLHIQRIVDKIPGPRAYFLCGNLHQVRPDPDDFFEQAIGISAMYQRPQLLRFWLAIWPYIHVHGAEEVEPILSSNKHLEKSREYDLLKPWLGLGLLTSAAQKWRPRRKLLTPAFHYDILKDFVGVYNQQAKILLPKLASRATGEAMDLYPFLTLCALDIICETAMGQHVNAQLKEDNPYVQAIIATNRIVHERQKKPWLWPKILFNLLGEGKAHDRAINLLHEFSESVINERYAQIKKAGSVDNLLNSTLSENNSKRRLAFLDLLLQMVERNEMPFEDVRPEVDTFMFEGHDTTSTGMNWLLYLLACYPQIQTKVQAELDEVFGEEDRDTTFEDLAHLKYLECCIKETLRLYPSVPFFTRTLHQDVQIAGYTVPAGTTVLINPYMLHRDPKHWPDPEKFDPDRFLPENTQGRHPFAFVPFSAGSRNCIGQRFALMEEKTVVSWFLRYFTVSGVDRRDKVRPKAELILRPSHGVRVKLTPRRRMPFKL